MDKRVIRQVWPFRRNTSVRRTHYSKDHGYAERCTDNETLNILNKAFKTIYWCLNLRMIMSHSQACTK